MASICYLKGRKRWWVRWRATNRKTRRVFAGSKVFLEKAQAVRHWVEMEAQEKLWRSGQVDTLDAITDVAAEFAGYCKRHTPRTRDHYDRVMARFLEALPRTVVRIQQLDHKHIEEYLYRLRDDGRINRTLNAHLTVIKAFCRYFARQYGLPNPAAQVSMLVEDPPEARWVTDEEYEKLLTAAGDLARDRIIFLAHTGLRATEFCDLSRSGALDPKSQSITITGKGRRRRTVPLNRACRAVLSRPHIYRPTTRNPLHQQIKRVARRAGVRSLGPHALRHYFATKLLLKGVPIIKVSKLLGHRSVRTTEKVYAHILDSDLRHVTEVLD